MNFTSTFSREQLQALPEKNRLNAIENFVNNFHVEITTAATGGKTFYIIDSKYFPSSRNGVHTWPPPYIPTTEDMIQGFKTKYIGCKVEYTEVWEETQPGVKTQKKGILIDWS
jgi:hypothetical protein